ncbi:hypothetical protein SAMN05421540_11144 [Psychroflexus halocasei]|uniref:Uncharacterized protein n=1 Tax=Psychroflexus halocasei TaxID=908615 RepID=A0A1H4DJ11_9FLAO|nr:hypothetical protein SAMN05421540_11144 [Psychroflexus halocasei]
MKFGFFFNRTLVILKIMTTMNNFNRFVKILVKNG